MTRLLLVLSLTLALLVPATASADFGFKGDFSASATPTSVAVAPDGSVWVSDELNGVRKYTPDGQQLMQMQVGRFGAGPVATDGAGNLYVGNRDDLQVQKFDPSGAPLATIGAGRFQDICGLDVDAAGNVYVSDGRSGYCDSTPRVQKFDAGGNLVREIKLTAKTDPDGVGDIAVDGAGNIFVADSSHFGKSEIFKLSPDGALVGRFGSRGSGPGQFDDGSPESIAFAPDGTLYAVDGGNSRIEHLTADGAFLGQFGASPAFRALAIAPNGDVYVTRGQVSVPKPESATDLGVNRVMRFGQDAPPAAPSPLTLSPSVKISVGGAVPAKNCGLRVPDTDKPIKNCAGIREATIEWSAGCPAAGPLARRTVEIQTPRYDPIAPKVFEPIKSSAADSGSVKVTLWAGSKVAPTIEASCVAYTADGEPVTAKGSAKGNSVSTAPVAYTGFMEYSRSAQGRLLGNGRGQKVKGAIKHGREVRLFWAAGYDESLKKGNKSVQVHIRGAGLKVDDYLHAYQLEDYGPRLLIKPRKPGTIRVWVTVNGLRSVNTVTLRAS